MINKQWLDHDIPLGILVCAVEMELRDRGVDFPGPARNRDAVLAIGDILFKTVCDAKALTTSDRDSSIYDINYAIGRSDPLPWLQAAMEYMQALDQKNKS